MCIRSCKASQVHGCINYQSLLFSFYEVCDKKISFARCGRGKSCRWNGILWICLNRDFDFGPLLQLYRLAILVLEDILYTDFAVKVVRAIDPDLGLFRFARKWRWNNLFDRAGQS